MVQWRAKCEERNEEATKLDHLFNDLQNKEDEEAGGIIVQLEASRGQTESKQSSIQCKGNASLTVKLFKAL